MHRTPLAILALAATTLPAARTMAAQQDKTQRPNVLLFFTDDQGYGDLSCQGHPTIHTPHIDALAASGMRLTQFYVGSPVCSPSRAALLTGCYPKRVSMHEHVVFPQYDYGLHTDEVTLADALQAAGYATGCFGKWHLGHRPGLLPLDQGFDVFEGVPYSNDMSRFHRKANSKYGYRLPWLRGNNVVEWEPDQRLLTQRTTDAAIAFVEASTDKPWFCYVPYSMPHIPLYASKEFAGRSPRGLYGDVIEEIDANVGRVITRLEQLNLRDNTIVLFTSDNGPWLPFKEQGGSAGPLRGGKSTNWEGGQRVPFVASWPQHIPPASVCRELVTAMDVLPTVLAMCKIDAAGTRANADRPIDGHSVQELLLGAPGATSPTEQFLYYTSRGKLAGIRRGAWKLWLESGALYHVEHDIGEQWDLAKKHHMMTAELRAAALAADAKITAQQRPVRHVAEEQFDPRKK
ncbi:MAG: sulfatase [Planctomycetota bacterium]